MLTNSSFYLSIRAFGPLSVEINGEPLSHLRSKKGLQLLMLLTLQSNRKVERQYLAEMLWPDSLGDQALEHLRRSLTDLRGAMGPAAKRITSPTKHTLRIDLTEGEADIVAFDALAPKTDHASLERLISHHARPLLAGWEEYWVVAERMQRQQVYTAALRLLAQQAQATGHYVRAQKHLLSLAHQNGVEESDWLALMQGMVAAEEYGLAHSAFDTLKSFLASHAKRPPCEAIRALYHILPPPIKHAPEPNKASPPSLYVPSPSSLPSLSLPTRMIPFAVFQGGWTEAAARAVCGNDGIAEELERMPGQTFLVVEERGSARRWHLREHFREIAWESLSPEERKKLSHRHAAYFDAWAAEAEPHIIGPEQGVWLDRFEQEQENILSALLWQIQQDAVTNLTERQSVRHFLHLRANPAIIGSWLLHHLHQNSEISSRMLVTIYNLLGGLMVSMGAPAQGIEYFQAALPFCRTLNDTPILCGMLANLSYAAHRNGDHAQALRYAEENIGLHRAQEETYLVAQHLMGLGGMAQEWGDHQRAHTCLEESRALFTQLKEQRMLGHIHSYLGSLARAEGHYELSHLHYTESLCIARAFEDTYEIALLLFHRGNTYHTQKNYPQAFASYRESVTLLSELRCMGSMAGLFDAMALLAADEGRGTRAARLAGAADALYDAIGSSRPAYNRDHWEAERARARALLSAEAFAAAWTEGANMPWNHAVAYAKGAHPLPDEKV